MIDLTVGGIGMEIEIDVCKDLSGKDGHLPRIVRLHFPANEVPQDVVDALRFLEWAATVTRTYLVSNQRNL